MENPWHIKTTDESSNLRNEINIDVINEECGFGISKEKITSNDQIAMTNSQNQIKTKEETFEIILKEDSYILVQK